MWWWAAARGLLGDGLVMLRMWILGHIDDLLIFLLSCVQNLSLDIWWNDSYLYWGLSSKLFWCWVKCIYMLVITVIFILHQPSEANSCSLGLGECLESLVVVRRYTQLKVQCSLSDVFLQNHNAVMMFPLPWELKWKSKAIYFHPQAWSWWCFKQLHASSDHWIHDKRVSSLSQWAFGVKITRAFVPLSWGCPWLWFMEARLSYMMIRCVMYDECRDMEEAEIDWKHG